MIRTRRFPFGGLGLACVASLASLLGAELFLRAIEYPFPGESTLTDDPLARFDVDLGWAYRPDLSKIGRAGDSQKWVKYFFDARGIRVGEPGHQTDTGAPSLLFIGGSFTMGQGVDYEESFVGRLDGLPGLGQQAVNLGVQAYGTDQALLSLERSLRDFRDVAAVVYTYIDAHDIRNSNYDRRLLIPTARFVGTKPLFALDGGRRPVLELRPRRYEDYAFSRLWSAYRIALPPPRSSELTRALVLEMQRVSNAQGARFVVVSWPWAFVDTVRSARSMASLCRRDPIFDGLGVDVIDTAAGAPQSWFRMKVSGDAHPNAKAHSRVSGLILRWLRDGKQRPREAVREGFRGGTR